MKVVNYLGELVAVKDDEEWLAAGMNGIVLAYSDAPVAEGRGWRSLNKGSSFRMAAIGFTVPGGKWKSSLRHIGDLDEGEGTPINYMGNILVIDDRVKWVSTDENGDVFGAEEMPRIGENACCWSSPGYGKLLRVGRRDYGPWRASLKHVDDLGV